MASATNPKDIAELFEDDDLIDQALTAAMRRGVREALRRHKQAGNPICEWRDGKVVWVLPNEIEVGSTRGTRQG